VEIAHLELLGRALVRLHLEKESENGYGDGRCRHVDEENGFDGGEGHQRFLRHDLRQEEGGAAIMESGKSMIFLGSKRSAHSPMMAYCTSTEPKIDIVWPPRILILAALVTRILIPGIWMMEGGILAGSAIFFLAAGHYAGATKCYNSSRSTS
jgi:hypothetical protein